MNRGLVIDHHNLGPNMTGAQDGDGGRHHNGIRVAATEGPEVGQRNRVTAQLLRRHGTRLDISLERIQPLAQIGGIAISRRVPCSRNTRSSLLARRATRQRTALQHRSHDIRVNRLIADP